MARTPRYNDGAEILTGESRGEQIPNAGRGVSVESLGVALEPALLDARGAVAMGRGAAAIGEGISRMAQPFVQLAEMQAKMINSNRVNEAQRLMATAEAEFEVERTNEGDETKWIELAKAKSDKVKELLGGMNLSQAARDQVDSIYDSWTVGMDGRTRVASAKKTRNDFTQNWMGTFRSSIDNGKLEPAREAVRMLREANVIEDGEASELLTQAEQGVRIAERRQQSLALDQEKNTVTILAESSPKEDVDSYIDSLESVDPASKVALKNYSQGIQRDKQADLAEEVVEGIVSGNVWNEYELEATYGDSPFMTPKLKRALLADIQNTEKQKERAQAIAEREGPKGWENFTKLYMLANEWQPEQGTEEAASEFMEFLRAAKTSTPTGYSGAITDIVRSKFGASDKKVDARPEVQKMVTKRLSESFEQDLSEVKAAQKAAKDILEQSPDDETGRQAYQESTKAYNTKFNTAIQEQARIERMMNDYYRKNPEADEEKTLKYLNGLLDGGRVIMKADSLWPEGIVPTDGTPTTPQPPSRPRGTMRERIRQVEPGLPVIDPSGITNDMPDGETSRGPSSSLLPNFYTP